MTTTYKTKHKQYKKTTKPHDFIFKEKQLNQLQKQYRKSQNYMKYNKNHMKNYKNLMHMGLNIHESMHSCDDRPPGTQTLPDLSPQNPSPTLIERRIGLIQKQN